MVTADEIPDGKGHDPPHPESCEGAFAQSTPSRGLRIAFLVLCTVGVLLSADLLRLHVRVHLDPNYHSLCAISETIDCESVAFSSYAVFAGLPVALWGLLGYLVMGGLSIWGIYRYQGKSVWPFGMLFWMSLFASLVSVILFSVSAKWIQSLCVICIVTYVVNFALLALAFAELKRLRLGPFSALREEIQHYSRRRHGLSAYVIAVAGALGVLYIAIPPYWQTEITQGPRSLLTGRTADGANWIGARKPVVEISEFSDYQCPFCLQGHLLARKLVYEYPDRVRLVHYHFPLQQHPEAFQYAKIAFCSGEQGKFWESNDFLFTHGRRTDLVTPREISSALGIDPEELTACLEKATSREAILEDLAEGRSFNIQGTPTFVIDGRVYPGSIPESVLCLH